MWEIPHWVVGTIPQVTSLEEGQRQKVCSLGLCVPHEEKRVKFFIKASLLGTPSADSQALWPWGLEPDQHRHNPWSRMFYWELPEKKTVAQTEFYLFQWARCNKVSVVAAAAKSHQLCPTLCDPTDRSLPGSPINTWKDVHHHSLFSSVQFSHSVMSDSLRPHESSNNIPL